MSIIAINRMLENSIKEGKVSAIDLKKKGKTVLSDVRKLKDEEIMDKLNNLGVQIDKIAFAESIRNFPSAESYYTWLMKEKNSDLKTLMKIFFGWG